MTEPSPIGLVFFIFGILFPFFLDPDMETRIEDILNSHELPFEKSEVWIAEERMYEVLYQTQIIGG